MSGMESARLALARAARADGLFVLGPGAQSLADELPPGAERRAAPPGTLVPLAEGAALAAPDRRVVAVGSTADVEGACLGDLLHAARRGAGFTCIVLGKEPEALHPSELVRRAGASFVAQAGTAEEAAALTEEALAQEGLAVLGVQADIDDDYFLGQAPLVTAIWTAEDEDWQRILYEDWANREET